MDDRLINEAKILDYEIKKLITNIRNGLFDVEYKLSKINGDDYDIDIYELEELSAELIEVHDKILDLIK
jgi:hypothetical protein